MKNRVVPVILAVACVGLGIAVIILGKRAADEKRTATETILDLSNKLVYTSGKWEEEKQNAGVLYKDLEHQKLQFGELTNQFTQISNNLVDKSAALLKSEAELKASQSEVTRCTTKIIELETQNRQLDQRALDLQTSLTNLNVQISDTEKKLATAQGDRAFLQGELKRLQAEKAELERQFNDVTILRAQVAKLKSELNVARRIEWIRQGLFVSADQKGAQKLMQGLTIPKSTQPAKPKPEYDLNVEIAADGSVKIVPPAAPATNSPPK